ncbi:predicted protein [Sclerotinia sclerotiorum 1980 UF-70]|uniref:Uncharacterized protein n=1 Tax=Sclerotinia sclerotiorum (strain ATCC 18683 / 1980 / Ss-1) TaxID=665079 RepID=A7F355_SCLS1|nr:predicted protein [Sclerotinia sclerotiorum 1980 UF-70]EDN96147.1 predicted protein [Sclerotinia sclerotiorum 1980 UF-70]
MIDLEHEALHKGNHPDYIDLRPPLDLLNPESLWTFDSYGPTIRMDLRFVWTYDSYGPTIRIPEYAGSIT